MEQVEREIYLLGETMKDMNSVLNDRYRRIFRDGFNFLLANANAAPTEEYWVRIAKEIGEVCGSLNNDPLAVDLLAAVYAELERCGNERQAKG